MTRRSSGCSSLGYFSKVRLPSANPSSLFLSHRKKANPSAFFFLFISWFVDFILFYFYVLTFEAFSGGSMVCLAAWVSLDLSLPLRNSELAFYKGPDQDTQANPQRIWVWKWKFCRAHHYHLLCTLTLRWRRGWGATDTGSSIMARPFTMCDGSFIRMAPVDPLVCSWPWLAGFSWIRHRFYVS